MKKYAAISALVGAALLFALAGCGANEKQEDLKNYLNNELPKITELEAGVVAAWDAVSGDNYKDDQTIYAALDSEIIPGVSKLADMAEAVVPKTGELKDIHALCVRSLNELRQAFPIVREAIREQDLAKMSEANKMLTDSRKSMRDFKTKLLEYARANKVEVKQ